MTLRGHSKVANFTRMSKQSYIYVESMKRMRPNELPKMSHMVGTTLLLCFVDRQGSF